MQVGQGNLSQLFFFVCLLFLFFFSQSGGERIVAQFSNHLALFITTNALIKCVLLGIFNVRSSVMENALDISDKAANTPCWL